MPNVIDSVVAIDRCCGCGVCAGVCPQQALVMEIRENGDLVPKQRGTCPQNCNICLEVCPFVTGIHGPRLAVNLGAEKSSHPGNYLETQERLHYHDDTGSYISTLVGYSERHRAMSSSGGLATFCLEKLLRIGAVDVVAVPGQNSSETGVQFSFRRVESSDELRQYSGSIYQPVEISNIMREMLSRPERRWAITSVPCLCTGIRKATERIPKLRKAVKYILSLACGMYQNCMYTELLIRKSGLRLEEVNKVEYRVKSYKGPASNFGFLASNRNNQKGPVIEYKGLPFFLGANSYFRLNACNYCKDVFAENADACFMDAWLPEYKSDGRGTSLVLVRNNDLDGLMRGRVNGKDGVHVESIQVEKVIASQAGHVHRKRYLIGMRLGHVKCSFNLGERFQWWLQRRTQVRRKWAWAKIGRRYGLAAFWLLLADLWVLQRLLKYITNAARFGKRIIVKVINLAGITAGNRS